MSQEEEIDNFLNLFKNILDSVFVEDIVTIFTNLDVCNILKRKETTIDGKSFVYFEDMGIDFGIYLEESDTFISLNKYDRKEIKMHNPSEEITAVDCMAMDILIDDLEDNLTLKNNSCGGFLIYDEKEKNFEDITDEDILKQCESEDKSMSIGQIYEEIKKSIVAQDIPLKQILSSIYRNQKVIDSKLDNDTISKAKENIIVYGPTGTGKTEILKKISEMIGVPIVIENATEFTESGYVGRDVTEMLSDLYDAANCELEIAERGILVIDEFDKLGGQENDRVSRGGVQRSLLKVLDGGTVTFEYERESFYFDTSKLTVVALGAFDGIMKDDEYSDATVDDFTNFGIMREIVGRFSKFIPMNALNKDSLKEILLNSNLSPLNIHAKVLESLNVKFSYDDDLIDYIASEAEAMNLGARSLKTIFESVVDKDEMFKIEEENKKEIHLTKPDKSESYIYKKEKRKNRKTIGF